MAWLRLRVTTSRDHADAAEEQFRAAGAVAVSLLQAGADEPIVEPDPGASPLWETVRIEGLFPPASDLRALRGLGAETHFVADRDWSETWRQGRRPMRFGRLQVLPKDYRDTPTCEAEATLRLDPGLAFGTGTHPSTALCLDWLGRRRLTGQRVLDVGCGSGILAIAAALLGAATVVGVDHDPQARQAAIDNAQYNGVDLTVLDNLATVQGRSHLVIANIVANTLGEMAPVLTGLADTLVLSGVLTSQVDDVVAAYPAVRFRPPTVSDGWAMLVGRTPDG